MLLVYSHARDKHYELLWSFPYMIIRLEFIESVYACVVMIHDTLVPT